MLIFGLINIVTASSREAVLVDKKGIYYYFYKQMIILFISAIGFTCASLCPTHIYKNLGKYLYIGVVCLIIYCFVSGAKRGAYNWIVIGSFQFQPSEMAKIILILCLAAMFEKYYKIYRTPEAKNHNTILALTLIVLIFIPIILFLQKDLGTALIVFSIVGAMFFASPVLKKEKAHIIILAFCLICFLLLVYYFIAGHILTPAQYSRITDFWRPCSKYESGGYQTCNAQIAINDGGLFGLGIGKSKQKYSYIPVPHTDSIFAIIAEEWGVIKCLLFIFLPYAIMLYRIMDISSKATTIRGRYIAFGVGFYIFAHIIINLGGLLGLIPLTGVPLPFLSYGGTYTLVLVTSMGLVQRVYMESQNDRIILKASE